MRNRLELFRERIAAFDGAADPSRAISRGYMIEEPRESSTNALFKRISLRPQSKNLLIGGIGSGKTTQLLRLQQLFQQNPEIGIYPVYVDVTEYTQPNDIQVGTLDAIIGLELIKLFKIKDLQIAETKRDLIQRFAYGPNVSLVQKALVGSEMFNKIPGVLPSRAPDSSDKLVQVLSSLVKDAQSSLQQTPYFLFDGLDRIDEAEKFTRIASIDLQASRIGFLVVGAVNLLYSSFIDSIDGTFNYIEYRSAFDIWNDLEAYNFFELVLLARAEKNLFEQSAFEKLIDLSGGVLRDLINLAQESIQEAYLDDTEIVSSECVEKAKHSIGRAKLLGLNKDHYSIVKSLTKRALDVPTSTEEIYLLSTGRILEYRFPSRRFALHPVVRELIF